MQTLVYTSAQNNKQLKEKPGKNASYIQKATLWHTLNKYILIYIIITLSCAIRHTLISYILMIKSRICTETFCTSLKNLLQCLFQLCTFALWLLKPRINIWTVMGPIRKVALQKMTMKELLVEMQANSTPGCPLLMDGNKGLQCNFSFSSRSPWTITSHTSCSADNWRVPLVLWLNTTAASASDTPSHSPPPEQTRWCSSPGIWILLKPL